MAPIRIIGLGNGMRGDDAFGLLAARRLRQAIGNRAEVIEAESVGVDLIDLMKGAPIAILVDAVHSGLAPGTVHRLDASAGPVSSHLFRHSTHAIGMGEVLELARIMGTLPATVIIYGVEVSNTEIGQSLSPAVVKALDQVVELILQDCDMCRA